ITYAGVETKTLFSPLNAVLTSYDGLKGIMAETDGTLETENTISLYTFIHYDYLSLNREDEQLIEALRKSRGGMYYETYAVLYYIANNAEVYDNLQISSSMEPVLKDLYDLQMNSRFNYWRYTPLPDKLPKRVVQLANEIAAPFDNDYDRVKAIEDYFQEGFVYDLVVEDVPEDRDFVDWFLFDSKEGYCTYYSTSMVTLVRSLGLPARYVEGFLTPAVPSGGDRYPVLNSNAHAWVEVYFEGVG
ncbi:MAG: transglutaminase domain-containing protein, partial [Clostridiales bacterium]|nr:transglutaminase domain-containing protein [Clostridiales bacterium]